MDAPDRPTPRERERPVKETQEIVVRRLRGQPTVGRIVKVLEEGEVIRELVS